MRKIKNNNDLKNCIGKIICFWDLGNGLKGKPFYYSWVIGISKDKKKLLVKSIDNFSSSKERSKLRWSKGNWLFIKDFKIHGLDWYVFDKKDLKKFQLLTSLD